MISACQENDQKSFKGKNKRLGLLRETLQLVQVKFFFLKWSLEDASKIGFKCL